MKNLRLKPDTILAQGTSQGAIERLSELGHVATGMNVSIEAFRGNVKEGGESIKALGDSCGINTCIGKLRIRMQLQSHSSSEKVHASFNFVLHVEPTLSEWIVENVLGER